MQTAVAGQWPIMVVDAEAEVLDVSFTQNVRIGDGEE